MTICVCIKKKVPVTFRISKIGLLKPNIVGATSVNNK